MRPFGSVMTRSSSTSITPKRVVLHDCVLVAGQIVADAQLTLADMVLDRVDRLGDERFARIEGSAGHQAAIPRARKSLGGKPNLRQKARLKLALFL